MTESFQIDLDTAAPEVRQFGETPSGEPVQIVQIRNGGAAANLMTWGASLQDYRLDGVPHALVLGSPVFEPYLRVMRFYGAMVGRVANRIADGRFTLDGDVYDLDRNEDGRTILHGGRTGTGTVNWMLDGHDEATCRFVLTCEDGQDGFPGTLELGVTYRLDDEGALVLEIDGRTDAPTFCNMAHHSYWNLDGSADVSGHRMIIDAEHYLPVDERQIPQGGPTPVAGTRFDFRGPRVVTKDGDEMLDHNYCLKPASGLRHACSVRTRTVQLDVETTEPGLQVYEGLKIDTEKFAGHGGVNYGPRAGLALEPQGWPDAPNRPDFPSVRLDPGQTYRQTTRFRPARTTD
ncbi:aldose epimerase family protein [Sulfitobacter sp. LCG007]